MERPIADDRYYVYTYGQAHEPIRYLATLGDELIVTTTLDQATG
jgi:hypothetical protein